MMTHMVMNGRIPQRFVDDDEIIGETSNMVETSSSSSSLATAAAEEEAKGSAPVVQVSIGQQKQQQQQQQQQQEDPNPSRRSGSPTRGVKKVPSLRRGAAAYAQLLQSAVKASIETARKDLTDDYSDDDDNDQPPTIPPPPSPYDDGDNITMDVDFEGGRGSSMYNSPTRGNKRRAYEQEDEDIDGSYRHFTSNIPNRRRRPSSEMEVEEN